MLKVYYGPMPGAIFNTAVYFRNAYQESWLEDEFARRMVKSVDRAEVVSGRLIQSRVLGPISPYELSGGVKTLLLIRNVPDEVFNASTCGNNCAWWILRMASERDVTINLRHLMDFGKGRFTLQILNDGSVVHSMGEVVERAGLFLDGGEP